MCVSPVTMDIVGKRLLYIKRQWITSPILFNYFSFFLSFFRYTFLYFILLPTISLLMDIFLFLTLDFSPRKVVWYDCHFVSVSVRNHFFCMFSLCFPICFGYEVVVFMLLLAMLVSVSSTMKWSTSLFQANRAFNLIIPLLMEN